MANSKEKPIASSDHDHDGQDGELSATAAPRAEKMIEGFQPEPETTPWAAATKDDNDANNATTATTTNDVDRESGGSGGDKTIHAGLNEAMSRPVTSSPDEHEDGTAAGSNDCASSATANATKTTNSTNDIN